MRSVKKARFLYLRFLFKMPVVNTTHIKPGRRYDGRAFAATLLFRLTVPFRRRIKFLNYTFTISHAMARARPDATYGHHHLLRRAPARAEKVIIFADFLLTRQASCLKKR